MGELDATEGQKDVATAVRGPGEAAIKAEYLLPVNRGRQAGDTPLDPAASGATKRARLCESGDASVGRDVAGGATERTDPACDGQVADRDWTVDAHYSASHSASSNRDKKDKHRGRNKQRPGMTREPAGQKLCPVLKDVLQTDPPARCTFKGECHFLHDLSVYMAAKPADLGDTCYMYSRHGRCPAGITCRFGASHTSAEYRSLAGDAALWQTYQASRPSRNQLAKPVQRSLWKRKYDFSAANAAVSLHDRRPAGGRGRGGAGAGHSRPVTAAAEHEQASAPQAVTGAAAAQAPQAVNGAEPTPAPRAVDGAVEAAALQAVDGAQKATRPEAVAGVEVAPTPEAMVGAEEATNREVVAGTEAAPTPAAVAGAEETTKPNDMNRADKAPGPEIEEIRRLHVTEEAAMPEPVTEALKVEQPQMVDASETARLGPVSDTDLVRQRLSEKKKVVWRDQLYLAPLTTVGNLPFRRLCRRLGADITCGEMAMASNLLQGSQAEWALVRRHSSEAVFGAQICGNNPGVLTRCAQLLNEQCQLDFIDINLGCPIELVYEQGGGAAMLRKRSMLENTCRSICDVIDIPLTLKMRTGVVRGVNLAKPLLTAASQWGVSMVTLHGRSREQRYTKLADWSYVAECAHAASPLPVFGNGDVLSWEEYQAKRSASSVAGIVVARGALIKPWIFTEIKESRTWDISSSERLELLKEYTNYGMEHWGSDTEGVEKTRRFLLEWLSFLYRYIPAGLLEAPPQRINERPPAFRGRDHLETMMASADCRDWIAISEMLLGKVPDNFEFLPKHKANSYS